jgi:hypothetical protein
MADKDEERTIRRNRANPGKYTPSDNRAQQEPNFDEPMSKTEKLRSNTRKETTNISPDY